MLQDPRLLLLALFGALILGRLLTSFIRRGRASPNALPLPPGPKPLPLLGNLHQLPKSLQWLHLYYMSKQYGPIMHLSMAGQPLIILSKHQPAYDLLNKRGSRYSDRPRMVMAGEMVTKGMHMLLRPYDDRYKLHQRMEAPLMTLPSASSYRPLQDLESRQLLFDALRDWDTFGEKGLDFHHHHERAMASFIYCLLYGYRLKTGYEQELLDGKRVQAEFARTGQVGAYLVDSIPQLNHLPRFLAPWKREADELFDLERKLHVGNLDKGLANPGWNFSKFMHASQEAQDMPKVELAFDLGILADAGLDTSTVALDWFIVAWITCGSRWVPQAQKLLDDVVGRDRLPTFEDRPKLAFIDAIASETLRWRPVVVGGVPHFTRSEDAYEGYRIPANSIVLANAYAITRDESVFGQDVHSFYPERWMARPADVSEPHHVDVCGLNTSLLKDLPQTGFGFGRRVCAGRMIARSQLFIQMARMLWAFGDVQAGVVDEATGRRHQVSEFDCTEGFVTLPKPFRAVLRPRGPWARDAILKSGCTHGIDHAEILNQVKKERREKGA
ncbi:cytochrome P450 [Sodiomyces alkalinus F11]|uniref:Cytochrome P450 n=1 Tax=Sodiomyces alkalinus (strain CBS 110278 / VKM F-3762 / F11) TaxID=1314773 RepID=A0A3N2PPL3_SODAK|nr:cytochrome P450 [Sodiomyces alkalinus F11]ROT36447.1 cytochrome P450 [Sodiomyces alkalinus F11]